MTAKFRTVVIGFGQIGGGQALDPVMARYFNYATHAQVLKEHPRFLWEAVIDPSESALKTAREKWKVPITAQKIEQIEKDINFDVAIIATPPDKRLDILHALSGIKAVFVEKPLGVTFNDSRTFLDACSSRGIKVQVNFWRRGDEFFRSLAAGELEKLIGHPLAAFGIYGNGLMNNGSHIINFTQMLLGEIKETQILSPKTSFIEGPIAGDRNVHFSLCFKKGFNAVFQAISFGSFREVGLDIWGEKGRLCMLQESLGIHFFPRKKNRAINNEWEIASDEPEIFKPTCGNALYHLYDNLAQALDERDVLWSSGEKALLTEKVVHELL